MRTPSSAWKRKPLHKKILVILAHGLLAVLAFFWLVPIFWVILTSFRAAKGSYSSTFFPTSYSLDHYVKLFTDFSVFNFSTSCASASSEIRSPSITRPGPNQKVWAILP